MITGHIVAAIRGQEELHTADNYAYLLEGRSDVRKRSVLQEEEALAETLVRAPIQEASHLRRATKIGGMAYGADVNGKWDGTGCAEMAK